MGAVRSENQLPAIVGDNMVLQQSCEVKLWGWAAPEAEVSVAPSWCGAVRTQADKKGRWCVTVATPAASFEPRSIALGDGDGEPVVLKNILIGEVVALLGAGPTWRSPCREAATARSNMRRRSSPKCAVSRRAALLGENRRRASSPGGCDGVPGAKASPGSVKTFSAIGYLFGRNLRRALNVPVGIIKQQLRRHVDRSVVPGVAATRVRRFRPGVGSPRARGRAA